MSRIVDCTEPDESPVPLEFFRRSHSQALDTRELLISVFKEVWDEFYDWEKHESITMIASLAHRPVHDPPDHLYPGAFGFREAKILDIYSGNSHNCCLVTEYDNNGKKRTSSRIPTVNITFRSSLDPHPPYQFCTPTSRSISWRPGDLDDQTHVPFIPYADEQSFDSIEYLEQFETPGGYPELEWQTMIDPDHEMIQLETIRRLYFVHKLTFSQIDAAGEGLFADRTRRSNEAGIIWSCSQRDELKWSGNSLAPFPQLPVLSLPEPWDVQARLNSVLRTFCPNLNCVQSHCSVHVAEQPDAEVPAPVRLNNTLWLSNGDPCDRDCFRYEDENFADKISSDPDDKSSPAILTLFPDLSPCELAVLCKKSCREVFALRCHMFPDHQTNSVGMERQEEQEQLPDDFFVDVTNPNLFTPPMKVCNHKGPCAQGICPCYERRVHCQRNCRCGAKCVLRWKGCKCRRLKGYNPCGNRCPCRRFGKECDPELCRSCGARLAIAGSTVRRCSNVVFQRNQPTRLEIRKGAVGLGAFSTKAIAEGDFLGEYVGETYNDEDPEDMEKNVQTATVNQKGSSVYEAEPHNSQPPRDPKDYVRQHKNLNYLFTLNPSQTLDADKVGNETRYFNHKNDPDVDVKVMLVNDEHRIGFFAKKRAPKGREMFISYGDTYWVNGVQPENF